LVVAISCCCSSRDRVQQVRVVFLSVPLSSPLHRISLP
jgi:hypothetical protein